jgi:hypothetical protein
MLRKIGILRIISIVVGGFEILILSELFRIYGEPRFRSSDGYILFNCAIVVAITVVILRATIRSPEWRSSFRILIVGSIGILGAASSVLLSLSLVEDSKLANVASLTGAVCGGLWLFALFVFLIVRAKIVQERFTARRQQIKRI